MAKMRSGLGRDFYSLLDDNILPGDKKNTANSIRMAEIEPRKDIYMEIFKMVNENDDVSISGILNNISGESLPDNRRTAVVMEKDGVRKEWSSLTEFCDENNFDYKNAKIGFCKRGHYKGWHKVA